MYSFSEIVERIKKIKTFTSDEDVATALRWNVNALSAAKKNDNIPYEKVLQFCSDENISLDLIFKREGKASNKVSPILPTTLNNNLIKLFHCLPMDSQMGLVGIISTYVTAMKDEEASKAYDKFRDSFMEGMKKSK
ncbi:MAG: hypothetical protein OEV42_17685 [Deltaproteobacteria bacterium]|nr:hypothetical protein [Deltaproteobacteria bacterium]